jgi:hypothetical protein
MKKNLGKTLLTLGIIFLIVGFAQQGFRPTFKSGMFNLGLIFTISGVVGHYLHKEETGE